MGQSLLLQAMPSSCTLYRTIASIPEVGAVFAHLLMRGGIPWYWKGRRPADLDETLDEMATWELLGSRSQVDLILEEIVRLSQEALNENVELPNQWAFLEKTQRDIERRLASNLITRHHPNPSTFAQNIVFGCEHIAPKGMPPAPGVGLRGNPPGVVVEAGSWLDGVTAEKLFDPAIEGRCFSDFNSLRRLYFFSAERGDAVLVGSEFTVPTTANG